MNSQHRTAFSCACVAIFAACVMVAPIAARAELAETDATWPSVGPGSDHSVARSQWVDVEVDHSGAPSESPRSSIDATGGPLTPGTTLGFDGVNGAFKGAPDCCLYEPPDTHAAVGTGAGAAGRVVEVTNSGVQIWDKTGALIAGPTPLIAFLPAVPNPCFALCPRVFDPKVIFDQHSGRFFIVVIEGRTPNPGGTSNVHIAVSTTNAPNNTGAAWTKMSGSALTLIGGVNTWFDYPSIGADNDSLFVTGNMFDAGGVFRGAKIRVFNKAALLAGVYAFVDIDIDSAVTPGVGTIQPAHVYGVTDSGNFYLVNRFGSTAYRLWEISGDPSVPVVVGNATRGWAAGTQISAGAPQAGTAVVLDTVSGRAMNAVYRNGQVWTTLSSDMDGDAKTEVFWAKIATNGGLPAVPTLTDSGFIDGSDGVEWTFMPAVNANIANDATIVYTQSWSDQFPEIRYASRAAGDPAGTFQASVVPPGGASPGPYDGFATAPLERWGDYAATVVDPDDDAIFWIAQEMVQSFAVNASVWKTRIYKLAAVGPTPTPSIVQTPTTTPTPTPTRTATATPTLTPVLTVTPTPTFTPPVLTPTPTVTGTPTFVPPNKCLAGKTKCVSKKMAGKLKCRAKCQKDPAKCGVVQTACEDKVKAKFDGGTKGIAKGCIGKLDIKNDGPCVTFGDTAGLESKVDAYVLDVLSELEPGPFGINKCLSGKTKCVIKKTAGLLKCREKCQKNPEKCGGVQTACEDKAIAKFDGGTKGIANGCIGKLDIKNDGPCLTFGDTGSLEAKVDAFVADVKAELEIAPIPTPTYTPAPGETSTPTPAGTPIACTGGAGIAECDGTCPPGMGCVYDDVAVECYCIETLNPCNWLIYPACGTGDCPPGLSCVDYFGWGCACVP